MTRVLPRRPRKSSPSPSATKPTKFEPLDNFAPRTAAENKAAASNRDVDFNAIITSLDPPGEPRVGPADDRADAIRSYLVALRDWLEAHDGGVNADEYERRLAQVSQAFDRLVIAELYYTRRLCGFYETIILRPIEGEEGFEHDAS